ncbi:hypothetical protein CB1_001118039 [Camelus ferus]|nr:hypothetical protein CB1_001118039 [Camelus ferus]
MVRDSTIISKRMMKTIISYECSGAIIGIQKNFFSKPGLAGENDGQGQKCCLQDKLMGNEGYEWRISETKLSPYLLSGAYMSLVHQENKQIEPSHVKVKIPKNSALSCQRWMLMCPDTYI